MAPFGDDKQTFDDQSTDSSDSNELKTVNKKQGQCNKSSKKMEETNCSKNDSAVVVDMCAENGTCNSKTVNKNSSTTTLQSCSCGPECGPEKCDGRKRSALVGWDGMRSKILICLMAAFVVWLVVYIPISLTLF